MRERERDRERVVFCFFFVVCHFVPVIYSLCTLVYIFSFHIYLYMFLCLSKKGKKKEKNAEWSFTELLVNSHSKSPEVIPLLPTSNTVPSNFQNF